ncbi:MAG TPA: neutral zinc metallopeptidase [Kofleriaceae bacterium]|nr:neutral zinc metallopeptidase [Kofleriaceae bacterium]
MKWTRGTRNDDVIDVRGRRGSAAKLGGGGSAAVDPETFTHGTSEQRVRWFRRGFETGRLEACDTFSVQEL